MKAAVKMLSPSCLATICPSCKYMVLYTLDELQWSYGSGDTTSTLVCPHCTRDIQISGFGISVTTGLGPMVSNVSAGSST